MPVEIFNQIHKQHVLSAIEEIDREGIRIGRQSTTYDLIYQGKRYPPKLVMSIAARYATGVELEPADFEGGADTDTFKRLKNLGFTIIPKDSPVVSNNDWSQKEVTPIVDDYFTMLQQELSGQKFNKAEHRRVLLPQLNNRTPGSVEFKHQNISAILAELGQPYIAGYKPQSNYQQLLADQVVKLLHELQPQLEPLFESFAEEKAPRHALTSIDFDSCEEEAPVLSPLKAKKIRFRPVKVNYLEKEQRNRVLGAEGEQFVIEYEKWRLARAGKAKLADEIRWVSKDVGDGTGYDILSKNEDGSNRFIEVKTTKLSKETPIYLTSTEIAFARQHEAHFYLYRAFNFDSAKKLFIRQGNYDQFCHLVPLTYKGIF
jgi:Domain of unknown function (DUF3883)